MAAISAVSMYRVRLGIVKARKGMPAHTVLTIRGMHRTASLT